MRIKPHGSHRSGDASKEAKLAETIGSTQQNVSRAARRCSRRGSSDGGRSATTPYYSRADEGVVAFLRRQGDQGRFTPLCAELLSPLSAGGEAERDDRHLDWPHRLPLCRPRPVREHLHPESMSGRTAHVSAVSASGVETGPLTDSPWGGSSPDNAVSSLAVHSWLFRGQARQAGGHGFEPSTAHFQPHRCVRPAWLRESFVPAVPEMPPRAYPGAYLGIGSTPCASTPSSASR
jgi:hypothetical protein